MDLLDDLRHLRSRRAGRPLEQLVLRSSAVPGDLKAALRGVAGCQGSGTGGAGGVLLGPLLVQKLIVSGLLLLL